MFISEIKIDTYNIPLPEPVEAYAAGVMKSFDLVVCRIKMMMKLKELGT